MRRQITLLISLVTIAAVGALTASPASSARPRDTNGKILISRADNSVTGQEQIYTVDPDGTDLSLLANDAEAGQWSHDGSRIALFNRILDFDTGSVTSLNLETLYPDMFLGCAIWSPDDARLACEGFGLTDPTLNGIYTVRSSDGGDLQRVTSNPGGDDCASDYSPNGKRLVFTRESETVLALFTVKLDGSGLRQLTPSGMDFNFCNASWSPQGNEIVFSPRLPNADYRRTIWVIHANGSGLRQIAIPGCGGLLSSPTSVSCFNPSWSPDGTKIVFARLPADGQRDIYTVNADGSGLFRVTNTPEIEEMGVDWGTHPLTP
jgi:Tol biopolymer transport system component